MLSALAPLIAVATLAFAEAAAAGEERSVCDVPGPAASAVSPMVHDGAWSYFGDPRSVAHGTRVFTGCVSTRGEIVVHQYDRRTKEATHLELHRNPEIDDHDNPSVVLWRKRVHAFYSPHSGKVYPLSRRMEMHHRVSRRPYDIRGGFGPERHIRTNTRGGLGFTYPNPVVAGNKLWLFWRGGDWYPTFSYTRDGVRWVKARTLVLGPRGQRPYVKYVGGPGGSIHMLMSDAHPQSHRTSLYYLRYQAGRFYRADGTRVGTMRDLPLRIGRLDRIYRFDPARGRGWPHDIALDAAGRPVALYTGRVGGPNGIDTFHYARWTGRSWQHSPIVSAGRGTTTFHSGGATLDHADPSRLVLSRRVGDWFRIELWRTADGGRTWLPPVAITDRHDGHSFRPVIPRGSTDTRSLFVFYVYGTASSFRSFQTVVDMSEIDPQAPRTR